MFKSTQMHHDDRDLISSQNKEHLIIIMEIQPDDANAGAGCLLVEYKPSEKIQFCFRLNQQKTGNQKT